MHVDVVTREKTEEFSGKPRDRRMDIADRMMLVPVLVPVLVPSVLCSP